MCGVTVELSGQNVYETRGSTDIHCISDICITQKVISRLANTHTHTLETMIRNNPTSAVMCKTNITPGNV
jgi:uncharacterized protein YrrD